MSDKTPLTAAEKKRLDRLALKAVKHLEAYRLAYEATVEVGLGDFVFTDSYRGEWAFIYAKGDISKGVYVRGKAMADELRRSMKPLPPLPIPTTQP